MDESADRGRPDAHSRPGASDPIAAALDQPATDQYDPVVAALESDRDLYDIATWEARTVVDELSVRIATALSTHRRSVLYACLVALLVTQALTLIVSLLSTGHSRFELLGLLALSFLPGVVLTWHIWYRYIKPPKRLTSLLFTFGIAFVLAGAATALGLQFELVSRVPGVGLIVYSLLIVVPVSELSKWAAVRLYAYRGSEFNRVVDGALYGAVAGLGFVLASNTLLLTFYASNNLDVDGLSIWSYALLLMIESPGQVLYAAVAGYYLGLAKFNPRDTPAIAVKGLVLAMGFHAVYTVGIQIALWFEYTVAIVCAALYFVGVYVYLVRKLRRYRHVQQETTLTTAATQTQADDEPNAHPPSEPSATESATPKAPSTTESQQSLIEQVTALQDLHQLDLLSDREFEQKRQELLDRL